MVIWEIPKMVDIIEKAYHGPLPNYMEDLILKSGSNPSKLISLLNIEERQIRDVRRYIEHQIEKERASPTTVLDEIDRFTDRGWGTFSAKPVPELNAAFRRAYGFMISKLDEAIKTGDVNSGEEDSYLEHIVNLSKATFIESVMEKWRSEGANDSEPHDFAYGRLMAYARAYIRR